MPSEEKTSEVLSFVADRWMVEALDEFAAEPALNMDEPLTRADALRIILEEWLVTNAYVPLREQD